VLDIEGDDHGASIAHMDASVIGDIIALACTTVAPNGTPPSMSHDRTDSSGAELAQPATHADDDIDIVQEVARAVDTPVTAPVEGKASATEVEVRASVPRNDYRAGNYKAEDVYIRLENTIYGPIARDHMVELLQSGSLTGYEQASTDLQHWTPLLYHPRMYLTGEADPDATHELLGSQSTLPVASRTGRSILDRLGDDEDIDDVIPQVSTPLAAILIKPRKVLRTIDDSELPVYKHLSEEEASAPEHGAATAPVSDRPPHPSDAHAVTTNEFGDPLEDAHDTPHDPLPEGESADDTYDDHASDEPEETEGTEGTEGTQAQQEERSLAAPQRVNAILTAVLIVLLIVLAGLIASALDVLPF